MNRSRMFILAAIAFTVAVVVTLFTYQALRNRLQPTTDTTEIVVAAQSIAVGARLTEADVRLAPWPRAVPIQGSFQKVVDLVGRGAVVAMVPNEPILESKLAANGAGAGLTSTIPEGMRAVSVKVNDVIGVAGFVIPGSRVDVILSGSPKSTGEVELAKVILENVQVLAAGQNVANDETGKPLNVQVVTLLVTPDDSQKLALAAVDGKIQLALRNPLDLDHMNPNAVRREGLYGASSGDVSMAAPAPKPAPVKAVVRAPRPPSAPAPVVAATVAPPPPTVIAPVRLEMQLIQGSKTEKLTFEKKPEVPGGPGSQN